MPTDNSIALQARTPNIQDSLTPIASMINLKQAAQQTALSGIDLQKQNQANEERLNLQSFYQNKDNWQTNGRIDLDKINSSVPALAPYTGADNIAKMSTLATNETTAIQAKQNLTTAQRGLIAGPIGVLGRAGVTDPQAYMKAIDDVVSQNPGNTDLERLAQSYKSSLGMTPPGSHVAQTAVTASQSLMGPSEQQSSLSPQAGLTSTGGELKETITQPAVGGNQPSVSMTGRAAPLTLPPTTPTIDNQTGQPKYLGAPPGGAPGSVPAALSPTAAAQIGPRSQQQVAVNQVASQAPSQHFNNQQIIHLAPQAMAGTGAATWSKVFSTLGLQMIPGDRTANFQRLGHFMALQAQNNAAAMGAGTDAAREMSQLATGAREWTPEAIISTAKINDALVTGVEHFNQGMNASVQKAGGNALAVGDFQNKWTQNFDVNAMRLLNAKQHGDTKEYNSIIESIGGKKSDYAKVLAYKMNNLNSLTNTGTLPQ